MAYYLAPSLVSLRDEINRAHPRRDKTSDGWIGDTAHAARRSDHNPDYSSGGVVRAIDVDKDGIDTAKLLRIACACPSTEYVIWNRKIYTRSNGFRAQAYNGSNPHDKHMHISIRHTKTAEAARKWGYYGSSSSTSTPTKPPALTAAQITERTVNNIGDIVDDVIAGKYGTSEQWPARVKAAKYDVNVVKEGIERRRTSEEAARIAALSPAKIKARTESNIGDIVDRVLEGKYGTLPGRTAQLRAAGYDPATVEAAVDRRLDRIRAEKAKAAAAAAPKKSNVEIAREILAGEWGNNPQRSAKLLAAGYSPTAVQAEVVKLMEGRTVPPVRLTVSVLADQVIAGDWGDGDERLRRITAAGYDYEAVQAEVRKRLA
jgi:hypothetical protein